MFQSVQFYFFSDDDDSVPTPAYEMNEEVDTEEPTQTPEPVFKIFQLQNENEEKEMKITDLLKRLADLEAKNLKQAEEIKSLKSN